MQESLKTLIQEINKTGSLLDGSQNKPIFDKYLPAVLRDKNLLTAEQKQYNPNENYTRHLLYDSNTDDTVDGGHWVVLALVWKPSAKTCIHNHSVWCTFGIHQGTLLEQRYEEAQDGTVKQADVIQCNEGYYAGYIPTGDDIHRIVNPSDENMSISIHFYGINIKETPSSILKSYPENNPCK